MLLLFPSGLFHETFPIMGTEREAPAAMTTGLVKLFALPAVPKFHVCSAPKDSVTVPAKRSENPTAVLRDENRLLLFIGFERGLLGG